MTVTTPPSSARTSSPIPFPSPASSASQYQYNPSHTPSRSSSTTVTAKRKQVKNACVNCQKACKKCDDQRPCSRCVKYGIEDGCINSQRKERKRKNQDSSESSNPITTTRIQLNLSSTRTRAVEAPVPMRLSSRNGIRPFPKELLESLQHEEFEDADGERDFDGGCNSSHSDHGHNGHSDHSHNGRHGSACNYPDHSHDHQTVYVCPQVTEEFKTLAKICSDLHTVLSQPHPYHQVYNYRPINPFMMIPDTQQPMTPRVQRSSYEMPRTVSPPPIIQRRSISPTQLHQLHQINQMTQFIQQHQQQQQSQMLLKPSSPIYNPQLFYQPHPHPQQQQQLLLRDLMNRTPPEEDQSTSIDDFPKQA